MSTKPQKYPKTNVQAVGEAYMSQLKPPGYISLWDPTPDRDGDFDEVFIGDVGMVRDGQFRRLFNVTVDKSDDRNGGRAPPNFTPIHFDPERDTETTYTSSVITQQMPLLGDHLTSVRLSPQERDSKKSLHFKITKSAGGPSFLLCAPEDMIVETTLKQERMDAWTDYIEENFQDWLSYLEGPSSLNQKVDPKELIIVRGWVKTTKWVVARLQQRGVYELYIDCSNDIRSTLTWEGKSVLQDAEIGEVRCGFDVAGEAAKKIREIYQDLDRPLPECLRDGDPCTRCLFIKWIRARQRLNLKFWEPPRYQAYTTD